METRRIGSLEVSIVGLGCNNFGGRLDAAQTASVVDAALEAEINFLDTADTYGGTKSEEYLGRALEGRRDKVVLATKFGMAIDDARKGANPAYVRRALDDSLRRLRTDHVDLYQLHQPDPETPIQETMGALDELVRSGKVREIGCSNFSVAQLREAQAAAGQGAKFVSVQNEFSLLNRDAERDLLPECERQGIAFLPYFPLAGGMLTGKYRSGKPLPAKARLSQGGSSASRFLNDHNLAIVEALIEFAESRGHSILDLAFSWLASHRAVASVIAGATSPEQVRTNVGAVRWRLTAGDLAQVDSIVSGVAVEL